MNLKILSKNNLCAPFFCGDEKYFLAMAVKNLAEL